MIGRIQKVVNRESRMVNLDKENSLSIYDLPFTIHETSIHSVGSFGCETMICVVV
jgi:hypothetical protein